VGGVALPSLTAYQILFGLCAGAAALGASIALLVPYPPGYLPPRTAVAAMSGWRSSQVQANGQNGSAISPSDGAWSTAASTSLPPMPPPANSDEPG
jgi:hypothetical protein